MEFELEDGLKGAGKLAKNKVFLIALIGVILMAVFVILKQNKNGNTGSEETVEMTLTYPQQTIDAANANMITESVNQQNSILFNQVLSALDDLEASQTLASEQEERATQERFDTLFNTVNNNMLSSNELMSQRFDGVLGTLEELRTQEQAEHTALQEHLGGLLNQSKEDIYHRLMEVEDKSTTQFNVLHDNLTNQTDRLSQELWAGFEKQHDSMVNFKDSLDVTFENQKQQIEQLNESQHTLLNGVRDEIANQNNLMNNQMNLLSGKIEDSTAYLSDRQALLSDKLNEVGG